MKAYYKNDLKHAYLILEGVQRENEDYQIYMLKENEIAGLLKADVRYVDNLSQYYYDISGKVSLQAIHEKMKLTYEEMKELIYALLQTIKTVRKYMLEGNCILLEPEYIYCEKERFYFCYFPRCKTELKEEFHKLTEYFVREVDYKDKKGVHLAYSIHKATMEENYSIERIMNEFERESQEEEMYVMERNHKNIDEYEKDDFQQNYSNHREHSDYSNYSNYLNYSNHSNQSNQLSYSDSSEHFNRFNYSNNPSSLNNSNESIYEGYEGDFNHENDESEYYENYENKNEKMKNRKIKDRRMKDERRKSERNKSERNKNYERDKNYEKNKNYGEEELAFTKVKHQKLKKQKINYEEMMNGVEEEEKENLSGRIEERREFLQPVKRLLERKKKGKWGYWDEIRIEEDDL